MLSLAKQSFYCSLVLASLSGAEEQCLRPLGVSSGDIKDIRMSASSSFQVDSVGPHRGRLNNQHGGGAWCPKHLITKDSMEYLEIDLGSEHSITGVVTQGRYANGLGQEFAEFYRVEYWRSGMDNFEAYSEATGQVLAG